MSDKKQKRVLGRGLDALLNSDDKNDTKEISTGVNSLEIDINKIEVNPNQPRSNFDTTELENLSNSIKELGIIQPITVRKIKSSKYEIISGERRYRASEIAGLNKIPCYVIGVNSESDVLKMSLVENVQRVDLDPIEIGLSYERLINEYNLDTESISRIVGKDRSTISNYIRLLKLDPIIQSGIRDRFLSMGHGRALINIDDRKNHSDLSDFSVPFQLEMLTVYLIRGFSLDLVNHVAKARNSKKFVPLDKKIQRYLGIGNATGLGMAPFLVKHPVLLNNWFQVRELHCRG